MYDVRLSEKAEDDLAMTVTITHVLYNRRDFGEIFI